VFKGAGEQLLRKIDRKKLRRGIDRLVTGHRGIGFPGIATPRSCGTHMTRAISQGTFSTPSLDRIVVLREVPVTSEL
jgi:hypothetical protein